MAYIAGYADSLRQLCEAIGVNLEEQRIRKVTITSEARNAVTANVEQILTVEQHGKVVAAVRTMRLEQKDADPS